MTPIVTLACFTLTFVFLRKVLPRLARHDLTFLGFNFAFLAILMNGSALIFLTVFLVISYALAAAAQRWKAIHIGFFIFPLVLIFAVFKKYYFPPLQPVYEHIPELIGLSYVIFRVLIIMLESRNTGKLVNPLSYLNYSVSMLTFMSGPIQRYREFSEDMKRFKTFTLDKKETLSALARFMGGVIKVIYLAAAAQGLQNYFMEARKWKTSMEDFDFVPMTFHDPLAFSEVLAPSLGFGLASLFYLVFLYFNFSGYTDMAIGLGRLLGFRLPENFKYPFAATSFLDFWTRWHISLSLWFRDYCFTPILKGMIKIGIKSPVIATLPAYFISFGLLGLWHGRTWPFILCGLMFAAASTANHSYRSVLKRVVTKETLTKLNESRFYQAFTSALTLFYISLAITGLWLPGDEFTSVWHSFSPAQAVLSFGLVIVCLAVCLYLGRAMLRRKEYAACACWVYGTIRRFNTPLWWGALAGLCLWTLLLPKPLDDPFVYFRF